MKGQGYQDFFKAARKVASQSDGQKEGQTIARKTKSRRSPSAPKLRGPADNKLNIAALDRPVSPKPRLPLTAVIGMALGLCGAVSALLWPHSFDQLISSIEVHSLGAASAEEVSKEQTNNNDKQADNGGSKAGEEKSSTAALAEAEKSAETKAARTPSALPSKTQWTPEEMSFFSKLNERKRELDLREAELNKLEEELQQQKVALEKRLQELERTRTQIADKLKTQVEVDKDKVDKLVEFYSNMRPQQAAKVFETLNEDLAVETLSRMKKKNAAEIMNLLDPKKAQSITEKFAGYKLK